MNFPIMHVFGGVRAYKMANSLANHGLNVIQVALEPTRNFDDYLSHEKIRVIGKFQQLYAKVKGKRLGIFKLHFLLYPLFLRLIVDIIRKNRVQLIHAHRHTGAALVLLAKKLFGLKVKVIFDYHDPLELEDVPNPGAFRKLLISLFYSLERWICKNADFVITQGEEHDELLKARHNISMQKLDHFYNPVDITVYYPKKSLAVKKRYGLSNNTVLFLGSIIDSFGIHNLILAAPKIIAEIKDVKFAIRGVVQSQQYHEKLVHMIKERGLTENFIWLPYMSTNELVELISSCEMGVILHVKGSLITETAIPNKIFEYMACGIPTVANNLPNLRRFIPDGYSGILCDTDNPEELASVLISLLKNRAVGAKIGRNARKLAVEKYNWGIECDKLLKMYNKMLV